MNVELSDDGSIQVIECTDEASTFIVNDVGDLVNLTKVLSDEPNDGNGGDNYVIITQHENAMMTNGFYGTELLHESVVVDPAEILAEAVAGSPQDCYLRDGDGRRPCDKDTVVLDPSRQEKVIEVTVSTEPATGKARNKSKACPSTTSKPLNYATKVQIPGGPLLFVSEAAAGSSGASQVVAMVTKPNSACTIQKPSAFKAKEPTPKTKTPPSKSPAPENPPPSSSAPRTFQKKRNPAAGGSKGSPYEVCFLSSQAVHSVPQLESDGSSTATAYSCELCEKNGKTARFNQFSLLTRHYLKVHQKQLLRKASVVCKESGCTFKAWKVDGLRHHLSTVHGLEMPAQKMVFASMDQFSDWKADEERRTGNQFVRSSGHHLARQGDWSYVYYTCRRSGSYQPQGEAGSSKRAKSSDKINGRCTSSITLMHDKQADVVHCEYWPVHYGHDGPAPQRNLSRLEKRWMLQLIERGWNTDEILRALRSAAIPGTTERMRKATRQDLANIVRSQGRRSYERLDADDGRSVALWLERLRRAGSLLLHDARPFLVVAMDDRQAALAGRHADGHVVHIVDVAVALRDDYRLVAITAASRAEPQAYLLAYALAATYEPDTLRVILNAVQLKTGGMRPQLIYCAEPTVAALVWNSTAVEAASVHGDRPSPVCLIPPWKVEEEWEEAAGRLIGDDNRRHAVRKWLEVLLAEPDADRFAASLQLLTLAASADAHLTLFGRYLADQWTGRVEDWARFRHPLAATAGRSPLALLEKELQLIGRRARHVKRLDKCLYSLDYVSRRQPLRPVVEFRDVDDTDDDDDIDDDDDDERCLRSKIAADLQTLERAVRAAGSAAALRAAAGVVSRAAQQLTSSDE